jgi:hypothetical protein
MAIKCLQFHNPVDCFYTNLYTAEKARETSCKYLQWWFCLVSAAPILRAVRFDASKGQLLQIRPHRVVVNYEPGQCAVGSLLTLVYSLIRDAGWAFTNVIILRRARPPWLNLLLKSHGGGGGIAAAALPPTALWILHINAKTRERPTSENAHRRCWLLALD